MNVISLCVICALGTGASLLCLLLVKTLDITWYYVLPVDCHVVVSLCCTLLVIKSQCMQQLMGNCSVRKASVALEVQLLAL
jgi:hypothetical protein